MEEPGNPPMDEITMVRQLLAEPPPPAAHVSARARRRLDKDMRGGALRLRRGRLGHLGARRLGPIALGAVAVGAAAAITVTALVPGGTHAGPAPTGARPGGAVSGRPAKAFLLAMAAKAAHQATGRYWCMGIIAGTRELIGAGDKELPPPWVDGAKHAAASAPTGYRYAIFTRWRMGSCMENPRPGWPGGTVGGFYQDLGARPASPADVAAWRRDGSPDHWQAWQAHQTVSAHPGPRHWDGPKTGQEPWGSDASLPSDPAKLKAVFLAHTPGPASSWAEMIERQERISYQKFEEDQFVTYVNAVLIGPVSPAVRAAAFQLLAGIKGVQMKPGVRGPEGQVGTAVWTGRPGSMPAGDLILIDPATGNLLAYVGIARKQVEGAAPGTVLTYTAFLDAHWTNHPPAGYLKYLKAHGAPTP